MGAKIAAHTRSVNGGELIHWLESAKKRRRCRAMHREASRKLYERIVAQSREPSFYTCTKIPDTVNGRFELIVLHLFLLLYCFNRKSIAAPVSQDLIDVMIEDLDRALRQMGVGDLSVGRKIKKMASITQVRLRTYETALEGGDTRLGQALSENLFAPTKAITDVETKLITDYVREAITGLLEMPCKDVMSGTVVFPMPPDDKSREFNRASG